MIQVQAIFTALGALFQYAKIGAAVGFGVWLRAAVAIILGLGG